MVKRWSTDPRYAHGYLVPVFSLVLLWLRRDRLADGSPRSSWGGLVLIVGAIAWMSAAYATTSTGSKRFRSCRPWPGSASWWRGWPSLRWSWPAIAFLVFMLPLPYRMEGALAHPLQRVATVASTFVLQTLGFPAWPRATSSILDEVELGVVEACSGLSMLFTFFAMATGMALVIRPALARHGADRRQRPADRPDRQH